MTTTKGSIIMKKYCFSLIIRSIILTAASFFGIYLFFFKIVAVNWILISKAGVIILPAEAALIFALLIMLAVFTDRVFVKETRSERLRDSIISAIPLTFVCFITAIGAVFLHLYGMPIILAVAAAAAASDIIVLLFVLPYRKKNKCLITEEEKQIARSKRIY